MNMDLNIYTTEMSKSIWDKAFFMDKIPGVKCILDFGCADGAMERLLAPLFPDIEFFGYDMNVELLTRAADMTPEDYGISYWHSSEFKSMLHWIKDIYKPDEICLNLSSVLHEVFSGTDNGIAAIREIIDELHPKYITIRDMYYDGPDDYVSQIFKHYILSECDQDCIDEFIEKFGRIDSVKRLIHFLMKYLWKDNGYLQELEENYFSWNIDTFKKLVGKYNVIFETHYMLPYYYEKWRGLISSDIHTHAQFILRRDD